MGAKLDGWSEHFNSQIWLKCYSEIGVVLENGGGGYIPGKPLPWSHLFYGVDESYFIERACKSFYTGNHQRLQRKLPRLRPVFGALQTA